MFGLSLFEIVIIAAAALIFLGPQKLPETMAQLGKWFVYLRRASNEFKSSFDKVIQDAEEDLRIKESQKMRQELEQALQAAPTPVLDHGDPISTKSERVLQNDLANPPAGS